MPNNLTINSAFTDNINPKFGVGAMTGYLGYAIASAPSITSSSTSWTIEGWVKASTIPSGNQVICGQYDAAWIGLNSSGFAALYPGTASSIHGTTSLCDGNWHHVAATFGPGGSTLWVDGVSVATSATAFASTSPVLTYSFGVKAYCTTVGGFIGSAVFGQEVDECAVWSYLKYTTTFTPPTSPYVGNETNLVALYHLDDLTGTDSIVPTSVPAIVTAPAITSIDVNVGTIATASSGTWSNNPYSFTYQWNRGGTPIAGATASTHTLVAADVGSTLTCTVIATNAVGASSSSTSAATATITTPATLAIAPNNAAILYSPGNWLVSSSVAKSINPGAYFRTTFTGELCILNFDVTNLQYPPPMIKYRIDGYGPWTAVSLSQSSIQCVMPTDTTGYDYHLLEVEFKSMGQTVTRWASPQAGAVSFLGLTVSSSSTLVLPNSLPLTAMVFGDSITEGYHTINSTASDVLASDAQISWARQLGTQLSAEVGVVGFASQGLLVAGTGGVPVFISTVGNMWSGQARTFPTLDFLVIVQGTNDTTQDTTTAWTALINYLVPLLPNTTKIFVVQPFSTAATHNNQVPFITAGIAASSYPTRAVYIGGTFMDTTDSTDGLHPEGWSCSAKIAPRLSTALRKYITAPPPSFQNML